MVQQEVRQYELQARSTETFGRVLCSARSQQAGSVRGEPVQCGAVAVATLDVQVELDTEP
jgi:hypothetical protein